ncbi:MAG: SurA N-terminal domain-containing protein [Sphingorhabdus sp.]
MITFIRSLINSRWGAVIALAFIAMIAVAFALGDVTGSNSFGGLSGGNIARVGNRSISLGEFNEAMDNRLKAERKENPTLDMARFVEGGGLDSTLEQLVNRYALAVFGDEYGVSVSKRLIDSEILKIPAAKGLDGKFSQEAFTSFLQQIGLSEKMVREDLTQNLYAQQILPAAASGPLAPDSLVLPYVSLLLEKRSGQVAAIPSAAFMPQSPPSEAVLSQYYRTNAVKFTIPEKRAISYALFDSEIIAAKAKPTDADIAAYFKSNAAQYSATETRNISQIIVPTQAAAKVVADKVAKGQSLATVATELGLSVTNKSDATRASLAASDSKAVADAVFVAAQGRLAAPTKGKLGWYVVRVDAVKQIAARSLAAVRGEIEATLTQARRVEMLADMTAEIEDTLADGGAIADVAKTNGLKVETSPKLLANGQNPANPAYKPIPEMQVILPAAFQMEKDGEAQLIELVPGQRFAIVSIADFEEAAPPPLASVRPIVEQHWALAEGAKKARAAADQVRKAVDGGKSLPAALAALGIKTPPVESLSGTRVELSKEGQPISPPLSLMFAMKKGTAKMLQIPENRGWFVIYLGEVIKGDASNDTEMLKTRKLEMSGMLQQEYAAQLIAAAANDVGVKKNEDGIAQLRTRLTNRDAN